MNIHDKLNGYIVDPNYEKESKERDAIIAQRRELVKEKEYEFIADWRAQGFPDIEFSSDIIEFKRKLPADQVEFILKWLAKMPAGHESRETLVRALMLAAKPFDGQALMELFDTREDAFYLKWAIGNTIESTRVLNVAPWLKNQFESSSLGKEKEMLVCALPKYLDLDEARTYLRKIYDHYPLHSAGTLARIGDRSDLEFILNKLTTYKGPAKAFIIRSVKKFEKRLLKKGL